MQVTIRNIATTIILTLCAQCVPVSAQVNAPDLPEQSGEVLHLFTDRTLYAVSEDITFSVAYTLDPLIELEEWSRVMYAELIKWDGTKIVQTKAPVLDERASGYLRIPENTKSGNYYVRAYTRWMRNYSPYLYAYVPVKVINPNTDQIDLPVGEIPAGIEMVSKELPSKKDAIALSGLKTSYHTREEAEITLALSDPALKGKYMVSIAKAGDLESMRSSYVPAGFEASVNTGKKIPYLPEIKNITLTGKVLDASTGDPVGGREVALSSTLNPFYFFIDRSDAEGTFTFFVPAYFGSHQFCLKSLNGNGNDVEFLISSDFCTADIRLPYVPFELGPEEKELAKEIAINAQLNARYAADNLPVENSEMTMPFYGKPDQVTYTRDYVELIDLKEFFFEIMPEVMVQTKGDASSLKLRPRNMLSIFPPLILLDNIPVANDNRLLKIPSRNIDRIEVINGGYIVNETAFSGVISIYSVNNNLGGMELNGDEQFFNYQLYNELKTGLQQEERLLDTRAADMRNLLYFHPGLDLSPDHPQSIRFTAGDARGKYTLTIRGLNEDNKVLTTNQFDFVVE